MGDPGRMVGKDLCLSGLDYVLVQLVYYRDLLYQFCFHTAPLGQMHFDDNKDSEPCQRGHQYACTAEDHSKKLSAAGSPDIVVDAFFHSPGHCLNTLFEGSPRVLVTLLRDELAGLASPIGSGKRHGKLVCFEQL